MKYWDIPFFKGSICHTITFFLSHKHFFFHHTITSFCHTIFLQLLPPIWLARHWHDLWQIRWRLNETWEIPTHPATIPPMKQPAWMALPGQDSFFYSWIFSLERRLIGKQMLVVHGARDSLIPISHSMALARVRNNLEFIVESQQVWKDRNSCEPDIGKPLYVQSWIYNIRRSLFRNANEEDKSRYF